MAKRVSIGKNSNGSPFTVSISGVAADSVTTFTQILFDVNQQPLRLMGVGYVGWITSPATLQGINSMRGGIQYTFPSGMYPIAMAAGRTQDSSDLKVSFVDINNPKSSPILFRQIGQGITVSADGWVYGLNFNEQYTISTPSGGQLYVPPPVIMYYAIMQNMG